ncbi:4289_t:CDS:2 [Racocetra fulgida]|uniref:4289_t:CDS:1 n=1 Tax=Racocetra fulgida TaxID=60492 RepID=A0A9N9FP94_9GLOM|nr:4289_t:CDS:2 [Racocetra fulgida]
MPSGNDTILNASRKSINKKTTKFPSSSTAVSPASDVYSDKTVQASKLLTSQSAIYKKTPSSTAVSTASDIYPDKTVRTLRQAASLNAFYAASPRFQSSSTAVTPMSTYVDVSISAPIDARHNDPDLNAGPITPISMEPISTFSAQDTAKYNPDKFDCKPSHVSAILHAYFL